MPFLPTVVFESLIILGSFPTSVVFGLVILGLILVTCSGQKKNSRKPPGKSAYSSKTLAKGGSKSKTSDGKKKKKKESGSKTKSQQTSVVKIKEGEKTSNAAISKESAAAPSKEDLLSKEIPKAPSPKNKEPKIPDEDYGEVVEPTESAKKRRQDELQRDKEEKVKKGFYQPNSDEDDTLQPIKSLKAESDETMKKKKSPKKESDN
uniref:Uncharacterized protein n=1 Tax=Panagrolaimus sp. JU765 TaxID=591449 RepID=A0AC34RP92_9BILA